MGARRFVCLALVSLGLIAAPALADPHTIRIATSAPEGTAWAREFHALSREIETGTEGAVKLKWYFGGIAGDELEAARRMERGQLDGIASGGMICERRAPSFAVLHLVGLYRSRDEVLKVAAELRPLFEEESHRSGLVFLGEVDLGPTDLFTRRPIDRYDQIQSTPLWVWDDDRTQSATLRAMGLHLVLLPLEAAGQAYEQGRHDGFVSVPSASLAFQWSTLAKYVSDLRISYLMGCMLIAERAFDGLSLSQQQVVRTAVARMRVRLNDVIRRQDEALIGGYFQRQGLTLHPVPKALRRQFFDEAARARDRLGPSLVAPALLQRVETILATIRASR